ncbi:MAG: gas vesicle protein GvpG [Stigonema ocellatum SAG 48.90 = DSM 106950]|nr:gas vesicle protein GvpG [Stigonema ocellatum SAG 48.90 = DSM 106950]
MLMKALLLPVTGPLSGLMWIGEQILERTNTEFDDQENLHKQLLTLQLSFDIGEISEEEFEAKEEELLLKIQALEEQSQLDEESEEEEDFEEQSDFSATCDQDEIFEKQLQLETSFKEKQNLVLLP